MTAETISELQRKEPSVTISAHIAAWQKRLRKGKKFYPK